MCFLGYSRSNIEGNTSKQHVSESRWWALALRGRRRRHERREAVGRREQAVVGVEGEHERRGPAVLVHGVGVGLTNQRNARRLDSDRRPRAARYTKSIPSFTNADR